MTRSTRPAVHTAGRAAGLALAAALALTGCGAGGATTPGATTPSASSTPTPTAPQPGATLEAGAFADRLVAGASSFTTMSVKVVDGKLSASGVMDQSDPTSPKLKVTMTDGSQSVEIIHVDGVTYGKRTGDAMYTKRSGTGSESVAPADLMRKAKGGVTKVTYEGPETIDGVPTDRYLVETTVEGIGTMQVWLDSKDRPVKVSLSGSTTSTYSDFDEPVTITAPPASEISG